MTRKDYELIASAIKSVKDRLRRNEDPEYALRLAVGELGAKLSDDNDRFDAVKFITACGF